MARRGAAARAFTAFAHRQGWLASDPGPRLGTPKSRRVLPQVLRREEMNSVLADCEDRALREFLVAKLKGEPGRREEVFRKQFEAEKSHGQVLNAKFDELLRQAKENPDKTPPKRDIDLD